MRRRAQPFDRHAAADSFQSPWRQFYTARRLRTNARQPIAAAIVIVAWTGEPMRGAVLCRSAGFRRCASAAAARRIKSPASRTSPMNATVAKPESGHRLSRAELRRRWDELADDPLVAAIPYKV